MVGLMVKVYTTFKQARYKAKVKTSEESPTAPTASNRKKEYRQTTAPTQPKPKEPKHIKIAEMSRMLKHQEEAKRRWEEKKMRILQEELAKGQMYYSVRANPMLSWPGDLTPSIVTSIDGGRTKSICIPGGPPVYDH